MKFRNGFVSNSSSSSFILDFKTDNPTEQDVRNFLVSLPCDFVDLEDSVSKMFEQMTELTPYDIKERLKFFKSNTCLKEALDIVKKSKNKVFQIWVSDHDCDEDYFPIVDNDEYYNLEHLLHHEWHYNNYVVHYENNH